MCEGVGTCMIASFSAARSVVLFSLKLSHSQYYGMNPHTQPCLEDFAQHLLEEIRGDLLVLLHNTLVAARELRVDVHEELRVGGEARRERQVGGNRQRAGVVLSHQHHLVGRDHAQSIHFLRGRRERWYVPVGRRRRRAGRGARGCRRHRGCSLRGPSSWRRRSDLRRPVRRRSRLTSTRRRGGGRWVG